MEFCGGKGSSVWFVSSRCGIYMVWNFLSGLGFVWIKRESERKESEWKESE
jgi:hypothetical protein